MTHKSKIKHHDNRRDDQVAEDGGAPLPLLTNPPLRLLTKGEVLELVGVTYPALWSWIRDGKFPAGRAIGFGKKGHVAWIEQEVIDWIMSRPPRLPKGSKARAA